MPKGFEPGGERVSAAIAQVFSRRQGEDAVGTLQPHIIAARRQASGGGKPGRLTNTAEGNRGNISALGQQEPPQEEWRSTVQRALTPAESAQLADVGSGKGSAFRSGSEDDSSSSTIFEEYPEASQREVVRLVGEGFANYAHSNNIQVMVFPDAGARLFAHASAAAWRREYPGERLPEMYFLVPQVLQTRADMIQDMQVRWDIVSNGKMPFPEVFTEDNFGELTGQRVFEEFIKAGAPDTNKVMRATTVENFLRWEAGIPADADDREKLRTMFMLFGTTSFPYGAFERFSQNGTFSRLLKDADYANHFDKFRHHALANREGAVAALRRSLPRLLQETDRTVMIADTCIHTGAVMRPLIATLQAAGFPDIRVGVTENAFNESDITPDFVVQESPSKCYALDSEELTKKIPTSPISRKVPNNKKNGEIQEAKQHGMKRRREIKQIFSA